MRSILPIISQPIPYLARAVLLLGMLLAMVCWWPGYWNWGVFLASLLWAWCMVLVGQSLEGTHRIWSHRAYPVLAGVGIIYAAHFLRHGLRRGGVAYYEMAGSLDVSLLTVVLLAALGICLVGLLLPKRENHTILLGLIAMAMMVSGLAALLFDQAGPARSAMAFLSFAGVCVWLAPLWRDDRPAVLAPGRLDPWALRARAGVALAVAALTAWMALDEAILATALMAGVMTLAGGLYRRGWMMLRGAGVLVTVLAVGWISQVDGLWARWVWRCGPVGCGETAFARISPAEPGWAILAATGGWLALLLVCVPAVFAVGWVLASHRRSDARKQVRAALWSIGCLLSLLALFSRGGLSCPATLAAVCLTWGLLPAMSTRSMQTRSGWWMLGVFLAFMLVLALAAKPGLFGWCAVSFGGRDKAQHVIVGFFAALAVAWMFGARRGWIGVLAAVGVGLAGGLAEWLQEHASSRGAEFDDWRAHGLGAAVGLGLYMLCLGARWRLRQFPDGTSDPGPFRRKFAAVGRGASWLALGWLVLLMTGATLLLSVFAVRALSRPSHRPGLEPVIFDRIAHASAAGRKSYVFGRGNLPYYNSVYSLMCHSIAGEPPQLVSKGLHGKLTPRIPYARVGHNLIIIKGLMQGPFAWVNELRLLLVLRDKAGLVCLDARDVLEERASRSEELSAWIRELQTRRDVAFIHPGSLEEYLADRRTLRRWYPLVPCLSIHAGSDDSHPWLGAILQAVTHADGPKVILYTGNEAFADRVRAMAGGDAGVAVRAWPKNPSPADGEGQTSGKTPSSASTDDPI